MNPTSFPVSQVHAQRRLLTLGDDETPEGLLPDPSASGAGGETLRITWKEARLGLQVENGAFCTERRAAESGPDGCDLRRVLGSLQSVSASLSW